MTETKENIVGSPSNFSGSPRKVEKINEIKEHLKWDQNVLDSLVSKF